MNESTHDDDAEDDASVTVLRSCISSRPFTVTYTVNAVLTLLPAVFGNSLIIGCYIKYSFLRATVMHKLILNLAISDLILGIPLVLHPVENIFFAELKQYKYVCLVRMSLISICVASSTLFMTATAIDRYLAVVHPLKHFINGINATRVTIAIIITWIISIAMGVNIMYVHTPMMSHFSLKDEKLLCTFGSVIPNIMHINSVVAFTIVSLADFTLYAKVIRVLKGRIPSTRRSAVSDKTKLMLYVHIAFFVCWLPYFVTTLLILSFPAQAQFLCIREWTTMSGFLNCSLNWIFYGVWNTTYRSAFRSVLCTCASKPQNNQQRGGRSAEDTIWACSPCDMNEQGVQQFSGDSVIDQNVGTSPTERTSPTRL